MEKGSTWELEDSMEDRPRVWEDGDTPEVGN